LRTLCLCGIDGAGKTTIANELARQFFANKRVWMVWFRWRALFTYILYFYSRIRGLTLEKLNPRTGERDKIHIWHKDPFLRRFYIWFIFTDMLLHYIIIMLIAKIRRVDILIFDRFFIDSLIDVVYEVKDSNLFRSVAAEVMYSIIKNIDLCVILDMEPTTAFSRKKDILNLSEITVKRKLYLLLAGCLNLPIVYNNDICNTLENIKHMIKPISKP